MDTIQEHTTIADHSLIGNCRSAALVSKHGAIDWYCIPEFHSPAIFSDLLDKRKGGSFSISPCEEYSVLQAYIPLTNVVETIFRCKSGIVKLTDCYVAMEEADKQKELFPDHEIIRVVEAVSGSTRMKFLYEPKTYYGRDSVQLKDHKKMGVHFTYRENILVLQCSTPALLGSEGKENINGEFIAGEGEKIIFSLSCSTQHPAIIPEINNTAPVRVQKTIGYWKNWIGHCKYDGVFKDQVLRSALTLKLLTHAPSGAIIAAPTTSLPEAIGGVRNWDYRFCWLRDASFTIRALIKLGYHEEADAYMSWILHATRLTQPKLQVVYTVFGNSKLNEKDCDWLEGYQQSKPVRIGNEAHSQFQLDVYGEVLDAVFTYSRIKDGFDNSTKRFITGLGKVICRTWFEPDEGIWEIRSSATHHTHSKVMAWVGLDRLIKLSRMYHWNDVPVNDFERAMELIRRSVERDGFNDKINSYVSEFGSDCVDASLLTLSLVNYCEAGCARMISTTDRIKQALMQNSFVYRHLGVDDGLPGKEGAFVLANFWLIENLAKSGKTAEAISLFEKTIETAGNDLLSEEIDPFSGEWLGNFPQGFSHIGLINAALTINESVIKEQKT